MTSFTYSPFTGASRALIGALAWLALATTAQFVVTPLTWMELLYLLAPLVTVPLGLLLVSRHADPEPPAFLRTAIAVQPFAAVASVASLFFPAGPTAAAFAAFWFAFTLFVGLAGAIHFLRNSAWRSLPQLCLAAALLYLPAGGLGLFQSRSAMFSLGFEEPIIFLTAVHFHFAGFATQILTALAIAYLAPPAGLGRNFFRFVAAGVIAAPALIGIGFIFSPLLKIIAIFFFATSLTLLAALTLTHLKIIQPASSRALLALSSLSIVIGMILATIYGIGEFTRVSLIDLARMTRFHGSLNAFGFTLAALLAWLLAAPPNQKREGN